MTTIDNDTATPSQTLGPLYGFALMFPGCESTLDRRLAEAVEIRGQVLDGAGEPVAFPDCLVELWEGGQFARTRTDAEGCFRAVVRRPGTHPLPDGTTEAPHLEVALMARGLLKQLMTRVYFPEETEANAADPALLAVPAGRRDTLLAERRADHYRFDIRLQGEGETVFFAF